MNQVLSDAVAVKAAVTLAPVTSKGAEGRVTCPMKFVAAAKEGIYLQSTAEKPGPLVELFKTREPLIATFCTQDSRQVFRTEIVLRKPDYWLTETSAIETWLIPFPKDVQEIDERQSVRHRLQDSGGLHGELFEMSAAGIIRPAIGSNVWDISQGGASFLCTVSSKFLAAPHGIRLQTVLTCGARKTFLKCRLIHARKMTSKTMRLGVGFEAAGSQGQTPEAINQLQQVIADLDNRRQKRAAG
jgi:hypothetical protein